MLKPVVTAEKAWELLEEKVKCRYKSVKVRALLGASAAALTFRRSRGAPRTHTHSSSSAAAARTQHVQHT